MKFFALFLLPLLAQAAYKTPAETRFILDHSPSGNAVQLGTQLTRMTDHVLRAQFDSSLPFFSTQPTGQMSFPLLDYDNKPAVLPANAIVTSCLIDVITQPSISSGGATLAIRNVLAGDLHAAQTIAAGYQKGIAPLACVPVGTAGTSYKVVTASTTISAVLSAGVLTGKFNVLVKYILSE